MLEESLIHLLLLATVGVLWVSHELETVSVSIPFPPPNAPDDPDAYSFPVDIVYTWVDSSDETWAALKDLHSSAKIQAGKGRFPPSEHSDMELQLSLLLVLRFLPWINTIYILTMDQTPRCLHVHSTLREAYNKGIIRMARHRDVLPSTAYPVFNSHAIETGLHRIPGLSEHFLYLNDDFLVTRPVHKSHFFTSRGIPYIRYDEVMSLVLRTAATSVDTKTASQVISRVCRGHIGPVYEAYALLAELGVDIFLPAHVPQALTKKIMTRAQYKFRNVWRSTAHAKFRKVPHQIPPIALSYAIAVEEEAVVTEEVPLGRELYAEYLGKGINQAVLTRWANPETRPYFACLNDLSAENIEETLECLHDIFLNDSSSNTNSVDL